MLEVKGYWKNYIDGAWVDGGAGKIDVINPGTGEKLAEQALADATDVDLAVSLHLEEPSKNLIMSRKYGGMRMELARSHLQP